MVDTEWIIGPHDARSVPVPQDRDAAYKGRSSRTGLSGRALGGRGGMLLFSTRRAEFCLESTCAMSARSAILGTHPRRRGGTCARRNAERHAACLCLALRGCRGEKGVRRDHAALEYRVLTRHPLDETHELGSKWRPTRSPVARSQARPAIATTAGTRRPRTHGRWAGAAAEELRDRESPTAGGARGSRRPSSPVGGKPRSTHQPSPQPAPASPLGSPCRASLSAANRKGG
jgi:hypothetical protein